MLCQLCLRSSGVITDLGAKGALLKNTPTVELDQRVFEFLKGKRSDGRPVTNTSLQIKAVQIAAGLGLTTFGASSRWLWPWKRRYSVRIHCGTNNSQKVPADYADQIIQFHKTIIAVCKAKKIDPSHIINMDHTMCGFDMPPACTNIIRRRKTIRIKTTCAEKKGLNFIVALAAAADGTKLPATIIFKECGGGGFLVKEFDNLSDCHLMCGYGALPTVG